VALTISRFVETGRRTSLPLSDLVDFIDALVADPAAPARAASTDAEILRFRDILDDAKDLELSLAPPLSDYIGSGVGASLGVAGLCLALTPPLAGLVAILSIVVAAAGGLFTVRQSVPLLRKDDACMQRLGAIERAQERLQEKARQLL
jgi:hypothetical protein